MQEMATNVSYLFTQLQALLPEPIVPDLIRTRVKSLYLLGAAQFTQGIQQRPQMPFQSEIVTTAKLYLANQQVPNMGFQAPEDVFDITNWQTRVRMSTESVKDVRHFRFTHGLV